MSSILQSSTRRVSRLMASTTSYRVRSTCPPGTRIAAVRQNGADAQNRWFHAAGRRYAQKDTQDKDSLKPRSTEYSKSSGGDSAAATESAFDGSTSSPEEGSKKVGKESGETDEVCMSWVTMESS